MSGALDSLCFPSPCLTKPVRDTKSSSRIVPGYCSLVANNITGSALKTAFPVENYIIVFHFIVFHRAGIGAQPMRALLANFWIYLNVRDAIYMK